MESARPYEIWLAPTEQVIAYFNAAQARWDELNKQRSDIDKEICDIQHYIELTNLNGAQGFMIYKRLQGALQRRREIKNEQNVLLAIHNCKPKNPALSGVVNAIKNMDTQQYKPRILEDLFAKQCNT